MAIRRITLCREGFYYVLVVLFIVAGAVFREENLLVMLAGLMLGPLLFNWRIVAMMLRRLELRRKLPRRICAGDPLLVELICTNRRLRLGSWTLQVQDTVQRLGAYADEPPTKVEVVFPYVGAGQSATTSYRCALTRRGRYQLGPFRVAARFPFGLVQSSVVLDQRDQLLVCPRLGKLSRKWALLVEAEQMGSERSRRRQGFLEGDYYGLREWRQGDSPRWIHWRTTAKLSTLAVRQFEQQRNRDVSILLDLWQPPKVTQRQLGDIEVAVSFAATALADLCRRGTNRVQLTIAGKRAQSLGPGTASMPFVQECLDELALAQSEHRNHLPEMLEQVQKEVTAGSRIIVISTRPAPEDLDLTASRRQRAYAEQRLIWINAADQTAIGQLFRI